MNSDNRKAGSWNLLFFFPLLILAVLLTGCSSSPWVKENPGQQTYSMLDIPLEKLHGDPDHYQGFVFEDRFKFFRIYHDRSTADLSKREQVILGKTHFTARPLAQYIQVIQIQITPAQERWIRKHGISRRDIVRARIRFAGIAPGQALAFDLLRIKE